MTTFALSAADLAALNANKSISLTVQPPPVTPPTDSLRTRMIRSIAGLKGKGVLLGQHLDIWSKPSSLPGSDTAAEIPVASFKTQTGKDFAAWGIVLPQNPGGAYDIGTYEKLAADAKAKGAIIQVTWYSDNPYQSGANSTSMPAVNFANTIKTGTAENTQMLKEIDAAIPELKKIGQPFFLRIATEVNGNWNYYGAQDAAIFQKWFQMIHDRMMADAQLAQWAIFVYNINPGVGKYTDYFPGKAYCDFATFDNYNVASGYAAYGQAPLTALQSLGLPIYLAESGLYYPDKGQPAVQSLDMTPWPALLAAWPDIVMVMCWCQQMAPYAQKNPAALATGTKILTLEEIPPFV